MSDNPIIGLLLIASIFIITGIILKFTCPKDPDPGTHGWWP